MLLVMIVVVIKLGVVMVVVVMVIIALMFGEMVKVWAAVVCLWLCRKGGYGDDVGNSNGDGSHCGESGDDEDNGDSKDDHGESGDEDDCKGGDEVIVKVVMRWL